MAPFKSSKASTYSEASSPKKQDSSKHQRKFKGHKVHSEDLPNQNSFPGVQKIKAALRQTTRLLAKDKLAADVRIKTERRLKALERDLAEAEWRRKERTMATRYHKIKFFERQKVLRKINKVKRQLDATSEKAEKKELKKALFGLRVDLNYILHYPKTKRYISLFPPEVRRGDSYATATEDGEKDAPENIETSAQRAEIRKWIKEGMERGELSQEPEISLDANDGTTSGGTDFVQVPKDQSQRGGQSVPNSSPPILTTPATHTDEFFGEDSEDDKRGSN